MKWSLVVEGGGRPLGVVVASANTNDHFLLEETLSKRVVKEGEGMKVHLCLDLGYDNKRGREAGEKAGFTLHIRRCGKEVEFSAGDAGRQGKRSRRYVVERCHAWLRRCRSLLVRWERKLQNYKGLLELACALLWYRAWKNATL